MHLLPRREPLAYRHRCRGGKTAVAPHGGGGGSISNSKFFSEGTFLCRRYSILQSKHPLFLHFLDYFSKCFLLQLKLLRHNSYCNRSLLEIPPKIGKNVGIHFYRNILSEINLPLAPFQYSRSSIACSACGTAEAFLLPATWPKLPNIGSGPPTVCARLLLKPQQLRYWRGGTQATNLLAWR